MSDERAAAPALDTAAHIEPFGVPGTEGVLHGTVRRALRPEGFASAFWVPEPSRDMDLHVGAIALVEVESEAEYELAVQCSGEFRVLVDGLTVIEGPLRFAAALPEYHIEKVRLSAGVHQIAIHAHGEGLTSRMVAPIPSFMWAELTVGGRDIPLEWRSRELLEYRSTGLRVSPLLGWVEWQSLPWTRPWWTEDSTEWARVVPVDLSGVLGPSTPSELPLRRWPRVAPTLTSTGVYRDTYVGYELDDLAAQFLLADDHPAKGDDADGQWWRFDLHRIRIGYLSLEVETSDPAEVSIAYADRLTPDGRPSPVVALSTGATRMIQHYSVGAGSTRISPLQALGGRYVEVRIRGNLNVRISDVFFVERDMLGEPDGWFHCDDAMLVRVWQAGIETLRASAEDSLVDSVRERGEWVGDVVSSALHIIGVGWGDYRLVKRALLHAAAGARPDGLVAGCGPGEYIYLGTYAAQWVTACLEVAIAEGSTSILEELEEPASANIEVITSAISDDGSHTLPWSFVDWGYDSTNAVDLAVIAHAHRAVESWIRWQELLRREPDHRWMNEAARLRSILERELENDANRYHSWTLAALTGVLAPADVSAVLFEHLENGFPVNQGAPRLRDPGQVNPATITPYFTNYSAAVLLDAGHGSRMSEVWRAAWGWMLERGAVTWWEVFDERWSQCHYWSGAPTWQMSRYGLGLRPDLDELGSFVRVEVNDLGLTHASGGIHLPLGVFATVAWTVDGDDMRYTLAIDGPLRIQLRGEFVELPSGQHDILLKRINEGSNFR